MHIYSPANLQVHATQPIQAPHRASGASSAASLPAASTQDEVQISDIGAIISKGTICPTSALTR